MTDWLDEVSTTLLVPNITEVCLTGVIASKNNPKSMTLIFAHPEDIANGKQEYENITFSYTSTATLNPTPVRLNDGSIAKRSVNLSGIQLRSLLTALGVDEPGSYFRMTRDELVDAMQLFVGSCVTCPMTGRVKAKDGSEYINFKFRQITKEDYKDPDMFRDILDEYKDAFGPSDLDVNIHREAANKRIQRPDNATVPSGAMDGDELI